MPGADMSGKAGGAVLSWTAHSSARRRAGPGLIRAGRKTLSAPSLTPSPVSTLRPAFVSPRTCDATRRRGNSPSASTSWNRSPRTGPASGPAALGPGDGVKGRQFCFEPPAEPAGQAQAQALARTPVEKLAGKCLDRGFERALAAPKTGHRHAAPGNPPVGLQREGRVGRPARGV